MRNAGTEARTETSTGRVLGRVEGRHPGGTLLCVAGIHGNEPAGVAAARRVLGSLAARRERMRGRAVALAGNLGALEAGRRFLERDLNRAWSPEGVEALRRGGGSGAPGPEDREQLALVAALDRAVEGTRGPVHVLDLHTTSGRGGLFTTVEDTLPNRTFALHIPAPLILGLEELVDGTFLEYAGARGWVGASFESGQHEESASVARAEAALWIAVAASGLLPPDDVPELEPARALIARDARHLPRVVEMRYRHAVDPGDGFRMRPGFVSFEHVRRGQPVADDARGPVPAPETGRILMPLYQEQGNDGFFVVREVRPFWLGVSRVLRRAGGAGWAHRLPGVRRHPEREDALVVDRRMAGWYALRVLHLLGYRRVREDGHALVVTRRRFDR